MVQLNAKPVTEMDIEIIRQMELAGKFPLRKEDELGYETLGLRASQAIKMSLEISTETAMVFVDGKLCALWGHGPRSVCAGVGTVWLLATPKADKHKVLFGKFSKHAMEYIMSIYNRVEVITPANNLISLKWLRWLRFQQHDSAIILNGSPFIFLFRERDEKWPY